MNGDNRLPVLASQIRTSHAGVKAAAQVAAEHAIAAATRSSKRRGWLPTGNGSLGLKATADSPSERRSSTCGSRRRGPTPASSPSWASRGAATAFEFHDPYYDPFAECDDGQRIDWLRFACFIGGWQHTEWLLQRGFTSPDEWLGPIGEAQRQFWGCAPFPTRAALPGRPIEPSIARRRRTN